DATVTGVQTCALPILRQQEAIARSLSLFATSEYLTEILVRYPEEVDTLAEIHSTAPSLSSGTLFDLSPPLFVEDQVAGGDAVFRSEERRVGKEWRWWW